MPDQFLESLRAFLPQYPHLPEDVGPSTLTLEDGFGHPAA
jgi:hypothetical protein